MEDSFKNVFTETFGEDIRYLSWLFNIIDDNLGWFKMWPEPIIFIAYHLDIEVIISVYMFSRVIDPYSSYR